MCMLPVAVFIFNLYVFRMQMTVKHNLITSSSYILCGKLTSK